jgi:protein TonB
LDNEALRVVKKMASEYKWIPGRQDGRNVRVKYTLPVTFRL